jgi:hypothetical protein
MRNIKEVRWIESTLWRVGEREQTNLDFSSHQRPKARQGGLSLCLVFVDVFLGRWLLVFAGVAFAVVTFGGGGRVFSFFVLVQVLQRSSAGSAICHGVRGARTRAAADAALITSYVFACVV